MSFDYPEREGQFNTLPLPYRARSVVLKDAMEELANVVDLAAYRQQKERLAQEAAGNVPSLQPTPEITIHDRSAQDMNINANLDDYRNQVDRAFENAKTSA